ncbi:MAG: gfo/Idh/MocA family oxidoreductase, partial [Clostridia bacterium]
DFMGDQAGIRLRYGADFTLYGVENGALISYTPKFQLRNHFENEINAFVDCVKSGQKLPSHIDTAVITAQLMQAIYDSATSHREIAL